MTSFPCSFSLSPGPGGAKRCLVSCRLSERTTIVALLCVWACAKVKLRREEGGRGQSRAKSRSFLPSERGGLWLALSESRADRAIQRNPQLRLRLRSGSRRNTSSLARPSRSSMSMAWSRWLGSRLRLRVLARSALLTLVVLAARGCPCSLGFCQDLAGEGEPLLPFSEKFSQSFRKVFARAKFPIGLERSRFSASLREVTQPAPELRPRKRKGGAFVAVVDRPSNQGQTLRLVGTGGTPLLLVEKEGKR